MNVIELFSSVAAWIVDSPWWAVLLLKITLVLAFSWLIHAMLNHANPRWRVVLWRAAAVGLIAVCATNTLRLNSIIAPVEFSLDSLSAEVIATVPSDGSLPVPNLPTTGPLFTEYGAPPSLLHWQRMLPHQEEHSDGAVPVAPVQAVTISTEPNPSRLVLITALTIWMAGLLFAGLRFVVGRQRLARLIAASYEAPQWITELASRIRVSMDVTSGCVRSSTRVHSPIVCRSSFGYTLLIPKRLIESSTQREMAAILTHEFAHLHGHDLGWNGLIRLIATLLWPHPLVWRMPATHVSACEFAADAESARWLGDPAIYVHTLAKVALGAAKTSQLPALSMARLSNVRKRLQRVHETFNLPPLGRRRVRASMLVAVVATIGLGTLQLVRAQSPPTTQTEADATTEKTPEKSTDNAATRTIVVTVVDTENRAIEEVIFKASVYVKDAKYDSPKDAIVESKSLGAGRFEVPVAAGAQAIQLKVSSPGLVPMTAMWQGDEVGSDLPAEFKFMLPPGTKISGRVIDEQSQPIADASVYLLVITDKSTRQQVDLYQHLVKTDATGVWACDVMPAKFNGVWIRLTHPDYASDNMFGETAGQVSIDDVRSGKHSMVMKKGVTVEGSVVDDSGKPISGATVYQGSDRFGSSYPEAKTDDAGRFSFANSKPGEMVLTIIANGHAPELKVVQVNAQVQPIVITLPVGNPLRIRTVSDDGKPLGGVMIAPDTWRGHRSLADIDAPRESDADGEYVWDDAPADEIKFSVLKQGWLDHRNLAIKPSEEVIEIKMLKPLVVTGTILDASTGKPIDKFTVVPGIKWEQGDNISWQRTDAIQGSKGKYVLKFDYPRSAHVFQLEAVGYEPVQSRLIQSNEGALLLDFELKPAKQLTGIVLTPSGEPAVGADVVMTLPNLYVNIFNGRMNDARDQPFVVTDHQGTFSFASQKEAFKLIALHDSGVAIILGDALQVGQVIKLEPWAKITGTLKIGNQPAAQTELSLFHHDSTPFNEPRFSISGRARADADGHFEFARVLPNAKFQISRVIAGKEGQGEISTHGVDVKTQVGITQEIMIGGSGRAVVGKVIVPETELKYIWSFSAMTPNLDEFTKPDGYDDWSAEQKSSWYQEWIKTPAGQEYFQQLNRRYAINPQADGSFRVDDVPAGRYNVQITITVALPNKQCGIGEQLGSLHQIITVPEMEGGRSDEPLDIGELTIKLRKFLNIGDAAPAMTADTLDGKPIQLTDFGGKYVLLDFWATWCGPCLAELPNLEKVKAELGDRNDFVILGLNMDLTITDAKKFLAEHPHDWLQAYIAPDRIEELQTNFGILGIPATFVIGPDGKVLAKDLRGEALLQQLVELLPKQP